MPRPGGPTPCRHASHAPAVPPLSDAERGKLVRLVEELHDSPEWQESLRQNGWDDAFLSGEKFGDFLDAQDRRVVSVLKELGL